MDKFEFNLKVIIIAFTLLSVGHCLPRLSVSPVGKQVLSPCSDMGYVCSRQTVEALIVLKAGKKLSVSGHSCRSAEEQNKNWNLTEICL